jgi:hypothetical protein
MTTGQSATTVLLIVWYQNIKNPFNFDISLTACCEIEFAHLAGESTEASRHFFDSPFCKA